MAAGLSVRSIMMREAHFIPESNGDICDTASQGSKDEFIEYPSDFVEDRFRVDRKKLEQMLQAPSDIVYDEGAEEFFQRIMDETNTQITWPSKLKIGAKSKKDPHIKVVGYPEDVRTAKDKIMAVLDTKSNRVTLKMDVSHTEHSHVIGKGGNNIKKVMSETGCHIHFPDSNRGSNVQEKSNQVSIAGQSTGVEKARAQIRELLPLVFMFELPLAGMVQPLPDASSVLLQHLQQTYSVTVTFKQRPRMYVVVVIVRGTVNNAKAVKEATAKLMEQLSGGVGGSLLASMQLEIAPQHHLFIIGRNGVNIKQIMQKTGASIHFPDPNNATPQRKGSVFITGSIESVFLARQQLIGCLPLVLMFDVKEDVNLDQGPITKLMEDLDVYISVKNKPKQPSKSVIVKSIERNAANMYRARARLLGEEEPAFPACSTGGQSSSLPTSCLGLTLSYLSHPLLSVNTSNTLLMMNGQHSPSVSSPHSCPATPSPSSPNHWISTNTGIYSPLMMVNPASTQRSLHAPLDILSHNGLHKEFSSAFVRVPTPLEKGHSGNNSDSTSPPLSPRTSPATVSINSTVSTGLKSAGTIGDIISREPSLTSSGHTLDLLGLSKTTGHPGSSNHFSRHLQNGEKSPESSGGESDGSDKRAPGIERKNSASSLFANHTGNAFDYETKKLLAMRAMQKKPEGESRIPTDMWAGLGFSKSMPEAAIRERMGQLTMRSPPMQPSYENPAQEVSELNGDIDRDPWRDPNAPNNPPVNRAPGEYPSPRKKYEFGLSNSNHVDSVSLPSKTHLSTADDKAGLVELFSQLGLGKYSDLFQQQEIDLPTFQTLTDPDLRELGITTFGARRKMLLAIADLNKGSTLRSVNVGPVGAGLGTTASNGHSPFHDPGASLIGARRPDIASLSGRW